jgi:hypothetical protein
MSIVTKATSFCILQIKVAIMLWSVKLTVEWTKSGFLLAWEKIINYNFFNFYLDIFMEFKVLSRLMHNFLELALPVL